MCSHYFSYRKKNRITIQDYKIHKYLIIFPNSQFATVVSIIIIWVWQCLENHSVLVHMYFQSYSNPVFTFQSLLIQKLAQSPHYVCNLRDVHQESQCGYNMLSSIELSWPCSGVQKELEVIQMKFPGHTGIPPHL